MNESNRAAEMEQADYVLAMMRHISRNIWKRREALAGKEKTYCEAGYAYNRHEGCSPTQMQEGIRALRRELLALAKMMPGFRG